MKKSKLLILSYLVWIVAGCANLGDELDNETKDWTAKQFYEEANGYLREEDYENAINYYELLESRFPFGPFAEQAQLEIAYAYFKFSEPESAISATERFIKLHPRHPHVDYAYYLKGLVNFNRKQGLVEFFLPRSQSQRDPGTRRQAFFDFAELVRKFPNSRYAQDSRQRMIYLRNDLAKYEVEVGDYYMRRGAYAAAVNRAKYVLENYDQSPAVADALALMIKGYNALGLKDLADDAQRVWDLNFSKQKDEQADKI